MHETPTRREAGRVATVAVLLAVTVVGLRTRGAFSHTPDAAAAGASGAVLATALVAAEGIALVAFVVLLLAARPHRRPHDDPEPERLILPWWAKTAGVLLAFGLLVTPFVVLLSLKVRKHASVPPPLAHLTNPLTGSRPNAAAQSPAWPLIAGMVIAIAVVLTLTWLTRRRRRPGGPGRYGRPQDRAAALAEGLAAGSAALQANHEPRTAIIACYAAMEQGFAAAGSAAAAADTPTEVLARATAAGIVRSASAQVLTGLFRRARYSAEPMTPADSAAAATALAQLRADLADADAGAGVGAGAGR
jgi:hypothetical protein